MPKCAWLLLGSILALLNQTIGATATINFALNAALWVIATPAALIAVAALAFWHLTNFHAPRPHRAYTHSH